MEKNEHSMSIVNMRAFDLPDLWYQVLKNCMEKGYERPVFRGARSDQRRKELDLAVIEVIRPSTRPIVPDTKTGIPPPTSLKYVHTYLQYLITPFKQEWEDYTYGERIAGQLGVPEDYGEGMISLKEMSKFDIIEGQRFSALDINQFSLVQRFLEETPETNRSVIEIGKPEDLLIRHPPCMRMLQFKVRYNKLHMFAYFRSWDAWGGLPSNLAALQLIKEFLVGHINKTHPEITDGKIFASSLGLHVYSGQWELANSVIAGGLKGV